MREQARPVVVAARIVGGLVLLFNGIPPLLIEFEAIDWTARQLGAYIVFLNVILAAFSTMLGTRIEAKVTPVANPRDDTGATLVPAAQADPII